MSKHYIVPKYVFSGLENRAGSLINNMHTCVLTEWMQEPRERTQIVNSVHYVKSFP